MSHRVKMSHLIKITFLIIFLSLIGCQDYNTQQVTEDSAKVTRYKRASYNGFLVTDVIHNNHSYLMFSTNSGIFALHDPACNCGNGHKQRQD